MKSVTRISTQAVQLWACDHPKWLRFVGSGLVCAPVRSIELCMLALPPLGRRPRLHHSWAVACGFTVGWESPGTTSQTLK